jgi:phenylacetate-coenzyme A ligase PaaK-like adenylate-forming protein
VVQTFRDKPYALANLRRIVDHARRHNAFYRRWIRDPENPPVLSREVFADNNDLILGRHAASGATSGSTGLPIRFSHSPDWEKTAMADTARFQRALGGPLSNVSIMHDTEAPMPPRQFPVTRPVDEQIAFILRAKEEFGCQAVTTYSSNAEILADRVTERGIDMGFVIRFGMYSEPVLPHQKALVSQAFPNETIWSTYSAKEFKIVAAMCAHENGYFHIMAHRLGVEILRDDGSPAEMGEPGKVVVTDYLNRRSPFIRYELGDFAIRGVCPCGSGMRIRTGKRRDRR